jgi:hypothetical protein
MGELTFNSEKFTKQLRDDVRGLYLKGINALSEEDYRVLAWKTAALPSPAPVDVTASPMHAHRIEVWRAELTKRLKRRESLERAKGAVPHAAEELEALAVQCDELATLILDAEELAPADAVQGRKSANTVERAGSTMFTGGRG